MPSKPWASGRTLTAAQRLRKRALDRQSHRQRRITTQSRLTELEASLSCLLDDRTSRPDVGRSQEDHDNGIESQKDGLRHSQIPTPWGSHDTEEASNYTSSHIPTVFVHSDSSNLGGPELSQDDTIARENNTLYPAGKINVAIEETQLASNINQCLPAIYSLNSTLLATSTGFTARTQSTGAQQDRKTTQLCNLELSVTAELNSKQVCIDELINQDSLIRGVLQGWKTLGRGGYICPLWSVLRRIDDLLFCTSSIMTRLVMLHTIHLMLLVSHSLYDST